MAHKTRYTVKYRRRREGRTNYRKRLELLKSDMPRLIVRKTGTQIIMQIAKYTPEGDKVLITTHSNELQKKGWKHSNKNLPAAYLTGMLTAKKAKEHKITSAILDIGLQSPIHGTKAFAALKGAVDGGLKIPTNEKVYPKEERISGKHIADYNDKHKTIQQDFEKIKAELK